MFREGTRTEETERVQELRTHERDSVTQERLCMQETLQALRESRSTETVRTETERPVVMTPRRADEPRPELTVEESYLLEQHDTMIQKLQQEERP